MNTLQQKVEIFCNSLDPRSLVMPRDWQVVPRVLSVQLCVFHYIQGCIFFHFSNFLIALYLPKDEEKSSYSKILDLNNNKNCVKI